MKNTYKTAGVDIDAGNEMVRRIVPMVKATHNKNVLTDIGLFGGFYDAKFPNVSNPVLVASTDGVGTKLKIAFLLNKHNTVGSCLVNHCVNDILCCGAKPLFFLDYFATGKLNPSVAVDVVRGFVDACKENDCALIGGETAEMPGMYPDGEYDLAGFAVGAVEKTKIIDGSKIIPGDVVLGLASSGAHSNGYSLIRKIIDAAKPDLSADFHGSALADVLMAPTRIYVKPLLKLMESVEVKGMAHITGGGLVENLPRILQGNLTAVLERDAWAMPPLFQWLQREGKVLDSEMHRVFNCGIGMIAIVAKENANSAIKQLQASGETVFNIGIIREREGDEAQAIVV